MPRRKTKTSKTTQNKTTKKKVSIQKDIFRAPRGMRDILPQEQPWWERVEKAVKDLANFYNFNRIETPILEFKDLFQRAVGEETDIVQKEMYVLRTRGGDVLALRPEGTAPVARAYVEHGLSSLGQPQKLFYWGPMFRHEKPQRGRYREHHQAGFEILGGANDPIYDAQAVLVFDRLLRNLKIKDFELRMNSIGCKVCRPAYKRQLQAYYKRYEKELCADCVQRLKDNPLRLLDCKAEDCQEFKEQTPNILDKLCANCSRHFKEVLEYLDELGIPYALDNQLVRGLDYYNQTVFEFHVLNSEAGALPAGGRYDYLIEMLGGKVTPAVGGSVGIERLVETMKIQEVKLPARSQKKIFFIHVGDLAKRKSLKVIEELRSAGVPVAEALGRESMKSQLRTADKQGSFLALIFGQKEIYEGSIIIRDLRTGLQETVVLSKLVSEIQKRFQ